MRFSAISTSSYGCSLWSPSFPVTTYLLTDIILPVSIGCRFRYCIYSYIPVLSAPFTREIIFRYRWPRTSINPQSLPKTPMPFLWWSLKLPHFRTSWANRPLTHLHQSQLPCMNYHLVYIWQDLWQNLNVINFSRAANTRPAPDIPETNCWLNPHLWPLISRLSRTSSQR